MSELLVVSSILSSLKTATDIAKFLRETDLSVEKAEMKLKLADLVSSLADAKMQITDVQEVLAEREKRIRELEEAFQSKDLLVKVKDVYFSLDENNKPYGEAYCAKCWEVEHKKFHLFSELAKNEMGFVRTCVACKTQYLSRNTYLNLNG